MRNPTTLIPVQVKGKQLDLRESVTCNSVDEATALFTAAKHRLLHPQCWHEITGSLSANFEVTHGDTPLDRKLQIGDYLKIDIPAPGSTEGNGHDWVRVALVDLQQQPGADESVGLRLDVSSNPTGDKERIAHFFEEGASSSFLLSRKGSTVSVSYFGRNERPNTDTEGIIDKARNLLVASGARLGMSDLQWTAFLKGLLKNTK